MRVQQKEKGFTIIEVVLVLAIAGLMFLMVLLAFPALKRNQQDTQRKTDLSRVITALTTYASNNRGALAPFSATTGVKASGAATGLQIAFVDTYLITAGDTFIDPAGAGADNPSATTYAFAAWPTSGAIPAYSTSTQNTIYYAVGRICSETAGTTTGAGARKVALGVALEGGGSACMNN